MVMGCGGGWGWFGGSNMLGWLKRELEGSEMFGFG